MEKPDITDSLDVARLAFSNEDGVIEGDLTWQSYVDIDDSGSITVDVYPDRVSVGESQVTGFRYRVEYLGPTPSPGEG